MIFRYLSRLYLKYFLIVFLALILFFVGLDYLQAAKGLPDSANLQVLYVVYKAFYGTGLLLPVALVLSGVVTYITLVRSNELVALYSLGYSKKRVVIPFFAVSFFMTLLYIAIHATPFAYSKEYADNIEKNSFLSSSTSNLFFRYNDAYVYFGKLYPLQKRAEEIRIFSVKNGDLQEIISAKAAQFEDNLWLIKEAYVIKKPSQDLSRSEPLNTENIQNLRLLEGFRPKILDSVYEGKVSFSILDAVEAIILLKQQNVSIDKVKSALLLMVVFPFFAPFLVVTLFYRVPATHRFVSLTFFGFLAVLATLLVWGLLFALAKLSITAVLPSEAGIVLPVAILGLLALYFYRKNR